MGSDPLAPLMHKDTSRFKGLTPSLYAFFGFCFFGFFASGSGSSPGST